jgi:hypothetical protein
MRYVGGGLLLRIRRASGDRDCTHDVWFQSGQELPGRRRNLRRSAYWGHRLSVEFPPLCGYRWPLVVHWREAGFVSVVANSFR